jgi:hypothetical protein
MQNARHAPHASPAEIEEFFSTGCDALTCEPASTQNLIDVPAVGPTPAAHLPASLTRLVDNQPPSSHAIRLEALAELERDGVLIQLLYAAQHLADARIIGCKRLGCDHVDHLAPFCTECQMTALGGAEIQHGQMCRVGRLLDLIQKFYDHIFPGGSISCGVDLSSQSDRSVLTLVKNDGKEVACSTPEQPDAAQSIAPPTDWFDLALWNQAVGLERIPDLVWSMRPSYVIAVCRREDSILLVRLRKGKFVYCEVIACTDACNLANRIESLRPDFVTFDPFSEMSLIGAMQADARFFNVTFSAQPYTCRTFSPALLHFEELLSSSSIVHDGNSELTEQLARLEIWRDANGNRWPASGAGDLALAFLAGLSLLGRIEKGGQK